MPISQLCPNTHPVLQIGACTGNNETRSKAVTGRPKVSPQLSRWSRARAVRSGRKLDRSSPRTQTLEPNHPPPTVPLAVDPDDAVSEDFAEARVVKSIYIVSDGTGWTAEHCVNAALGQFDYCLVDRGCPVSTHLFSAIDEGEKLLDIIKQAVKEGALLVYTLADPSLASAAEKACKLWGVPSTNVLGPITEAIASHLGVSPSGLPRGASGIPLSDDYFRRIEAIEFTIKQDDGASPQNLAKADIVLTGVSRTGKTPLSIYLSQKGYKVANVPIVMGVEMPKTLFQVDPKKVFGLTINHAVLQDIRKTRAKTLGLSSESRTNYSEMDYIREELEFAGRLFAQNPFWPVIVSAILRTTRCFLCKIHGRFIIDSRSRSSSSLWWIESCNNRFIRWRCSIGSAESSAIAIHLFSLSIKLTEKKYLLCNQQVESIITAHKLHCIVANPMIPRKWLLYQKWLVQDQMLFTWLLSSLFQKILPSVIGCKHLWQVWEKDHKHFHAHLKAKVQ